MNGKLRRVQWLTAAGLSFSHGANDAQKSMGIITMVLVLGGYISEFVVPLWVVLSCAAMITLGTLMGGWRIVRTVGFGIYKVRPLHAVNAQLTSAVVIFGASMIGAPVSTTHVVSSSIMGIGASERPKAVRWGKAREIISTWLITIPGAALAAAVVYWLVRLITGVG
jgi:PiT family inorganic phosphate transporter